jgi:hypothetical protein
MKIKKFNEFEETPPKKEIINEEAHPRTELFGVERKPSNVISRQQQDFYDFYTHKKFRGKSKYELNSEVWKMAQRKDDMGILAQFCLQIERESIAADDYIFGVVSQVAGPNLNIDSGEIDDPNIEPKDNDDISPYDEIEELDDRIDDIENKINKDK